MPRRDYKRCRNCNRHTDEVGPISNSRLCGDCAREILLANIDGISRKEGLAWARWRIGTVASTLQNPAIVNMLIDAGAFAYTLEPTEGDT